MSNENINKPKSQKLEFSNILIDDLLNILVQNSSDEIRKYQLATKNIENQITSKDMIKIITPLIGGIIASACKNAIILVYKDKNEYSNIAKLNAIHLTQEFLTFTKDLLGKSFLIYGITYEEWLKLKKNYNDKRAVNLLPKPKPIDLPYSSETNNQSNDDFELEIFGQKIPEKE